MTSNKALKFADDGYATLLKIADFLLINFSLFIFIALLGEEETAIDVTAGFIFSIIFLLGGEYLASTRILVYAECVLRWPDCAL